jgi:agmatinase
MSAHRTWDPEGRADSHSGLFGLDVAPEQAGVVLVAVPFDAATSWGQGAANAPRAILAASHQMDLYDPEVGTPYETGITLLDDPAQVWAWNETGRALAERARGGDPVALAAANELGERLSAWVEQEVSTHLKKGKIVGTLGGDHSTAYGAVCAHLKHYPQMGLLQIDAHADVRLAYEGLTWSHASVMRNVLDRTRLVCLVQVGVRDVSPGEVRFVDQCGERVITHFDQGMAAAALAGEPFVKTADRIIHDLPEQVYVSLDIDGLDASLCPHTGTPVPGGLSFHQACALLAHIPRSGRRLVGFDLSEVAPGPGPHAQSWDALVAAQLLYRLCGNAVSGRTSTTLEPTQAPE